MTRESAHNASAPYSLLAPFLIVFAVFTVYPLAKAFVLSTQQTYGPEATVFVGLSNFTRLASDPQFHKAVVNTLWFTAGSVFVQLPVALGLALLLNRKDVRWRGLFRLIFFAPQLVGLVFTAVLGAVIYQRRVGLVNQLLHWLLGDQITLFGLIEPVRTLDIAWLETLVMPTLIITALWMYAGFNMVFFLAALQNIDPQVREAALIDGAGPCRRFLVVTLPAIRPVAGFVVLLSIIGSLQLFELPFIMLNGPGVQDRGLMIVTYLYQTAFEVGDLGYASAIGWALTLMLVGFTVGQRVLARGEA